MRIAFLLSFYFISTCLFAQQTAPNVVDSLLNSNPISQEELIDISAADSLINLQAADSLLNFSASDSLLNLEPIDSLRGTIGKVESGIQTINDSISRATQVPDSLRPEKLLAPITNKVDTVKLKVNAFADSIKSKVALPDSLKKLVPDDVLMIVSAIPTNPRPFRPLR